MILVDTSIWVAHLSKGFPALVKELQNNEVVTHPFVLGELALGGLKQRDEILNLLMALPKATRAEDAEVMALVEKNRLYSRGIGWVDTHLLAAALLSECSLWTFDSFLIKAARVLQIKTL